MKYRGLALEVHPDKNKQAGATDAFHMLNDAFREVRAVSGTTVHALFLPLSVYCQKRQWRLYSRLVCGLPRSAWT